MDELAGRTPDQGDVEQRLRRARIEATDAVEELDGKLVVAGEDELVNPRRTDGHTLGGDHHDDTRLVR